MDSAKVRQQDAELDRQEEISEALAFYRKHKNTPSNTSIPVDELRLKVLNIIDEKRSRYKVSEAIAEFAQAYAEQVALEARANEIRLITDEVGLFTKRRNKFVYNVQLPIAYLTNRVSQLQEKQSLLNKKGEN